MNEQEAATLARALLDENGLQDWEFIVDEGNVERSRLGVCQYETKRVAVSSWAFEVHPEQVEDTVRHEVAHAVVGPGKGHGLAWKIAARQLGASTHECFTVVSHGPVHITKGSSGGFVAKQGQRLITTSHSLMEIIAIASAYCSKKKDTLVVNFQTFVEEDFSAPT